MNETGINQRVDFGTFAGWLALSSPDMVGEVAQEFPNSLKDWAPLTEWPAPIVDWPDTEPTPEWPAPIVEWADDEFTPESE